MQGEVGARIDAWVQEHRDRLVQTAATLVATPSETVPPEGHEGPAQAELARLWRAAGGEVDVFDPADVPGLTAHPLYRPEWDGMPRPLRGRPVVVARYRGRGGGRSLLLSAHVDTMPGGPAEDWSTGGPFVPRQVGDRLYGRGAYDTKGMLAVYTEVARCVAALGLLGRGDLLLESVPDEEYGGSHGCLAARLRGYQADLAVNGEPTHMVPCAAHHGGGEWKLVAEAPAAGLAFGGEELPNPIVALSEAALALDGWRRERERQAAAAGRTAPGVYIAQFAAGGQRYADLFGTPRRGHMYVWIEEEPEVTAEEHEAAVRAALAALPPSGVELRLTRTIRHLPGSRMPADHAAWPVLEACYRDAGLPYRVGTAPFACDTYVFNRYSPTPALTLGPGGGGAHAPDEWVSVRDLVDLVRVLARLVASWTA